MGKEAPPPNNIYSLATVRVGCYGGREKDRLYPEFVNRLHQQADVMAKSPATLPRCGGIRSGEKRSLRSMPRPPKRENIPADLQCLNCGHHFMVVPQIGDYVAEIPQPVRWVMSSASGVACPTCGSGLVEGPNG